MKKSHEPRLIHPGNYEQEFRKMNYPQKKQFLSVIWIGRWLTFFTKTTFKVYFFQSNNMFVMDVDYSRNIAIGTIQKGAARILIKILSTLRRLQND